MNTLIARNSTLGIAGAFALVTTALVSAQDPSLNVFDLAPRGEVVANQPYSAELVSTTMQVLGDGTRIERSVTGKVYRDSAGRIRREQTIQGLAALTPTADEMTLITITDPVARVTYTIDERNRTARQSPYVNVFSWTSGVALGNGVVVATGRAGAPAETTGARGRRGGGTAGTRVDPPTDLANAAEALQELRAGLDAARQGGAGGRGTPASGRGRGTAAGTTESLGIQTMEGLTVTGRRTTQTIPVGQIGNDRPIVITDERWESAELQVLVLSQHHDPRTGDVEYRLRNVSRVEPPADLFTVPPGYRMIEAPTFMRVPAQPQQ